MATTALIDQVQRFGNQMVERYRVTVSRGETAPITITSKYIRKIRSVAPYLSQIGVTNPNQATIFNYPLVPPANAPVQDMRASLKTGTATCIISGTYNGTAPAVLTIRVSTISSNPDKFTWKIDTVETPGTYSAEVDMATSPTLLGSGLSAAFPSLNAGVVGDLFIFYLSGSTQTFDVRLEGYGG